MGTLIELDQIKTVLGASSLATNGYQILSNGLILQWAAGTAGGAGNTQVDFPIPFPHAVFQVIVGILYTGTTPGPSAIAAAGLNWTTSHFILGSSGALAFNYLAIGN